MRDRCSTRRLRRATRFRRPLPSSASRVRDPTLLFVLAGGGDGLLARGELADEILEPESVPLLERGALALAVVGQDDEVVRAWRVRRELLQGA